MERWMRKEGWRTWGERLGDEEKEKFMGGRAIGRED